MASPPQIPAGIVKHAGPMIIGHQLNWALHGVLSVQVYLYYLSFPNDKSLTKATVAVIYILEILQTVLATRDAFRDFGPGWGNLDELNKIGWVWFSVPVMSSLISCLAQLFYARRIWIISQRLWVPVIVVILALTQAGAGISEGISAHKIRLFSEMQRETYEQLPIWLGGTALCDVIIASSMLYYLYTSRTGIRSTNLVLTKMIRITVETGMLCAAFAVLDLVLDFVYPDNDIHVAPALPLSKLYSNSLLALLNARIKIIGGRGEPEQTFIYAMSTSVPLSMSTNETGTIPPNPPGICINIESNRDNFDSVDVGQRGGIGSAIPEKKVDI